MSETEADPAEMAPPRKKSKLLLVAPVLALLAGGGGFYAVQSGLVDQFLPSGKESAGGHGGASGGHMDDGHADSGLDDPPGGYVFLDPMVISLGPEARSKHLKVTLVIDVSPGREHEISDYGPRVVDILQNFLRAVDEREFEIPTSMERLRAQMLRRVQLVTPAGAARDVLIQEFVLN